KVLKTKSVTSLDAHTFDSVFEIEQLKDQVQSRVAYLKAQITENHKSNRVTMPAVKSKVLAPGCSKHMTGDSSRLKNFIKKFIRTVRFGNDHFGAIMSYGDYVIGDSVISKVYYVEGLGHNLFSVRQFYDFDLEFAFRKYSCYVRDMNVV
nr:integrase, catalytic region, zinc finger, CCHC-type, peptidase aspartic, catalytic [Tanacetum cinerariifolium]